jgi:hypothetical protein
MNNANTTDIGESMAYQRGIPGNPFLIVLHQPGAAEMLENRPAVDCTGRNLISLFEMIRNELKAANSELERFLYLRELSIVNVDPVPAYDKVSFGVNYQAEWSRRIVRLLNQSDKQFVLSFGNPAHDFITRYKTALSNQVVIEVCHVGTQGLNSKLQVKSDMGCCPLYKRLKLLSFYLVSKILKQESGTLKDFDSWIRINKQDIISTIDRSLFARGQTIRRCVNFTDYEKTVLQVVQ